MQHDAFTWQIEDGKFVKAVDIEAKQKRMNEALNQWIFTLPEEERQLFVETLFQVIDQTGVTDTDKNFQSTGRKISKAV